MVRMKGGIVIKEGIKSKYFFGSCYILIKNATKEMNVKSIKIEGVQYSLIANFEITQTFSHSETTPQEAKYVFPNDLKICIYDTTFVIGEEVIKPELKPKEEAKEIYDEAVKSGKTAIYGTNDKYSLTEFKLGNIPPNTDVKVIIKVAFTGQLTSEKTFFFKFPLDVYTPSGSQGSLYSIASEFSFTIQGEKERIKSITSNISNGEFDEESKNFSLHNSENKTIEDNSIILTFETIENIQSSALLSSSIKPSKYDGCALIVSPNLPPTNDKYSEFIFVVDCSGSMGGTPIKRASECLEFFIKSLPDDSHFNIIRFGSRFEKLFKESVDYTEENVAQAIELAQNLLSDFGGTDIYSPLKSIYNEENKNGQRQIFIITDGEVYNVEELFNLVSKNSNNNRIFTIGLGRFCDAGLVEGLARLSGGKSDFVDTNDSISEKVIPQLQASFHPSFTNVEIHIENEDSFEISPFPIKPINPNGSEVFYLRKEKNENSFKNGILVNGVYGLESCEFPIENIEDIENVEEDAFGCSGGKNIGDAVLPLFAFGLLQSYESKENISDIEKEKAIELSISSGVLCKYTGYVGMSPILYKCRIETTARLSVGGCTPRKSLGAKAARKSSPVVDAGKPEFPKLYDLLGLTRYQRISGFWENLDEINVMLGLSVNEIDGVDVDDEKIKKNCIATILAIAAMRVKSAKEKNSWLLIEQKALNWLKKNLPNADVDQIIKKAEKLIH